MIPFPLLAQQEWILSLTPIDESEEPTNLRESILNYFESPDAVALPPGFDLENLLSFNEEAFDNKKLQWLKDYIQSGGEIPVPLHYFDPEFLRNENSQNLISEYLSGNTEMDRAAEAYEKWLEKKKQELLERCKTQYDIQGWESVGPRSIGGRTFALLVDPNDSKGRKVWAGSSTAGLWMNENVFDQKSPWSQIKAFWDDPQISDISFDTNNPKTLYVCTGREGGYKSKGFWRSLDAGKTWNLVSTSSTYPALGYTYDMIVNPEDGAIYIGSSWRGGVLIKSTDRGKTWRTVISNRGIIQDMELGSNNILFVAINRNGVFRANNSQPESFRDFIRLGNGFPNPTNFGRVEIAIAPSDEDKIYAFIDTFRVVDGSNRVKGVYVSQDRGNNWTFRSFGMSNTVGDSIQKYTEFAFHTMAAKVHPTDPDVVFFGGQSLLRSLDGGATWDWHTTWIKNSQYGFPYMHADLHQIYFHPQHPDTALFVNDGGVYFSDNSRTPLKVKANIFESNLNYHVTQFYWVDFHPELDRFIGGSQDNGIIRIDESKRGFEPLNGGGDGGFVAIDQDSPEIELGCNNFGNCKVWVYDPHNNKLSYMKSLSFARANLINPAGYDHKEDIFINPIRNEELIFTKLKPNPKNPRSFRARVDTLIGSRISCLVGSPFTQAGISKIFLGTENGTIYSVSNPQSSSNVILTQLPTRVFNLPQNRYMRDIIWGASEDEMVVLLGSFGIDGIYETKDGGVNWESKQGDLPQQPIYAFSRNPKNRKEAVVASFFGVFLTENFDAEVVSWRPLYEGLGQIRSRSIRYKKDGTLVLGTYGGGVFKKGNTAVEPNRYKTPYTEDFSQTLNFITRWEWDTCNSDEKRGWTYKSTYRNSPGSMLNIQQKEGCMVSENWKYRSEYEIYDNLTSPIIDLSGSNRPFLSFDYAYPKSDRTMVDRLEIDISLDGGSTWVNLWRREGEDLATIEARWGKKYEPSDEDWNDILIPLNNYSGQKSAIFRFRTNGIHMSNDLWLDKIFIGDITLSLGAGNH